jgi:hypothetical protein
MINVKRFGFNTTRANCYVVSDETKECVIIDPCAQGKYERELFQRYIQEDIYGFEHIKTTAVAGIDILKDKLRML